MTISKEATCPTAEGPVCSDSGGKFQENINTFATPVKNSCSCQPNCSSCKTKNKAKEIQMCKYVQPEVRTSFKPLQTYTKGKDKMEDYSVYRLSYIPSKIIKSEQVKPSDNIRNTGEVSKDTVHKLTYQPHTNVDPTMPYRPCRHNLLGSGPMGDVTTQKHDYVRKPIDRRMPFLPAQTEYNSEKPVSNKTTSRLSYLPIDLKDTKVQQIRHAGNLTTHTGETDHNTVQRLSYIPFQVQEPVDKPWSAKLPYQKPELLMSGNTVYRNSYLDHGDITKVESYKKIVPYLKPSSKMEVVSTYGNSFQKGEMIKSVLSKRAPDNINVGEGQFYGDTIYRQAYQKHTDATPAILFRPLPNRRPSKDPMQDLTTHKHDYVPKLIEKVNAFVPPKGFEASDEPFTDKTTNRLSYRLFNPSETLRVEPCRFKDELVAQSGAFETQTVHKLSYKPCVLGGPVDKPWAERRKYSIPELRMNCNTVYGGSFEPPGTYIPCTAQDPDCIPCPITSYGDENNYTNEDDCCSSCCCSIPVTAC